MGATAFLAITGGMELANAYNQSKAIKEQGRYQQGIAEQNARTAELQAEDAIKLGQTETQNVRRVGKKVIGSQRTAYAGQGVDVNSGTPQNLQEETSLNSELDALTVGNNAWREAWGYKAQASDYRSAGRFARLAAKNEARNTLITGGLKATRDFTEGAYLRGK